MADTSQAKNQHYVPQFILRRFANADGRMWVYDKWSKRSFVTNPRNVASENAFYDVEINGESISIEPAMCAIENAALNSVNSMIDTRSLAVLSSEDRNTH
jgi:hypothetical protein